MAFVYTGRDWYDGTKNKAKFYGEFLFEVLECAVKSLSDTVKEIG